jgi:hypothetical protein
MRVSHVRALRPRFALIPLIYLVLPSLPLALLAHRLALIPPGYINLEYLLIGAISVLLPQRAVFVLLLLESLADFASAISKTYMLSMRDLIESLLSVHSLPTWRILEISAVLALVILVCAAVASFRPRSEDRFRVAGCLLFLIALIASVSLLAGRNPLVRKDMLYTQKRLARAPILSLVRLDFYLRRVDKASHRTDNAWMNSASSRAVDFLSDSRSAEDPDVVLILVESWGLPRDAHLAQALTAAYSDPRVANKFNVSYGSVPFDGSTVPGETRELCHSKMGFNILLASPELLNGCLPAFFHERKYENISVHGYIGSMFQRNTWYPKVGFDRSLFGPDLEKLNLPDCPGAFPGVCDAAIAKWIGSSLLSANTGGPRFIYWVTLNSHLPVPAHPSLSDDGVCSTLPSLQNSAPLCSWFRLVRNVHQSVQQLALTTSARPTVFVLVGDHAPPFADPELGREFSHTEVPYVLLTPVAAGAR